MAKDKDLKTPNVPPLRFPGFTDEWKQYAIDELAEIYGRIGFRGYTTADLVEKGNGAISLSPSNIIDNHLYTDKDNTYISYYKYEESPEIKIYEGDVIFVKTGSTVGKVAFVDKLDSEATLNPQLVVFKQIKCDNYLFSQIMATTKIQKIISKITVGGAVPTLSQSELGKVRISLPDKNEQQIISSLLASIDERIATQNKIIDNLQSLIKGLNDKFHDEVQGEFVSFSEIGTAYSGLSGKSGDDFGQGSPFITYLNVYQNNVINEDDFGLVTIAANESQHTISYGDVLFTLSSETPDEVGIGSVYLGESEKFYLNSFCFGVSIPNKDRIYPPYLAYLVSSTKFRKFVYPLAQGSTRFNLQKNDFMKKKFILPTIEEQHKIANTLDVLSQILATEQHLNELYTIQKEHLLCNLFI